MSYSPGSLPPADPGYHYEIDPTTGEYFQYPDDSPYNPPPGSVPVGGADRVPTTTAPDGTVTVHPDDGGPTREQIEAAERGRFFEGRSFGQEEEDNWIKDALNNGVPQSWIDSFLARNPHDANRIYEQWLDEQTANGAANRNGTGGSGSGAPRPAFAAPPNEIGWMPTLDLPTWNPPAPFQAPAPFEGIGDFSYPEYQKPADYVPGEFEYADYVKPADYVPGTFSAPTIEEARTEPGFQFALDEGRRQMEASAAAKGIGRTGGTVKRLIGYGQEMADTNYGNVFNRTKGIFDTNEGNREEAYNTNAALGFGEWNANRGNAFDNFVLNEGNRAGAFNTNAALGFGAWDANRANAANTFATNYGVAKDKYEYGYKSATDEYNSLFGTSKQKHDYDTAEALGEFKPKETEATLTHQQAFAEWLAKMGIAEGIFNEGSD